MSKTPTVGMGATTGAGSDRYPWTIHVIRGTTLWASNDKHGPNKCVWPDQDFDYSNDNQDKPENWTLFTLRKDGRWHAGTTLDGSVLYIGERHYYQDPSF